MALPVRDVAELERLLQAERLERIGSVQTLQRDVDCQQKLLTQLTEQVLSLQRGSPLGGDLAQVGNRVAALETIGGHPKLTGLEEAVAQLSNRLEAQEKHQDLQASALCEGLTEIHVLRANLTAASPLRAPQQSQSGDGATSKVEELLSMTAELARVFEVDREARNYALAELDERLTGTVDECLHVKDTQALFEAWERSGVDKYGRVASELAEMWDILEARMQESSDRLERVEMHLFHETKTPRTASNPTSLTRYSPRVSQIVTPCWRSESGSELATSRISLATMSVITVSGRKDSADTIALDSGEATPKSEVPIVDTLPYVPRLNLTDLVNKIKASSRRESARSEFLLHTPLDVSCRVHTEPLVSVEAVSEDQSQESSTTAESHSPESQSDSDEQAIDEQAIDEEALPPVERLRVAYRRLQAECEAACRHAVQVAAPRVEGREMSDSSGPKKRLSSQ